MSRKHYIEVASVIAAERAIAGDDLAVRHALENITRSLADLFKRDNSRFDRDRFYTAAGLDTSTGRMN